MDLKENLRSKLRESRKLKKLTQEQAAELVDIDYTYYKKIETGKVLPSLNLILKLSKTFDFTINEFFNPDEKSPKYHAILDLLNKCEEKDLEFLLNIISDFVKYKNRG